MSSHPSQAESGDNNLESMISILKHLRTVATLAALGVITEALILEQPLWGAIFPCSFFTGLQLLLMNMRFPIPKEDLEGSKFLKFRKLVQENTDFLVAMIIITLLTEDSILRYPERYEFYPV